MKLSRILSALAFVSLLWAGTVRAQSFDFEALAQSAASYTLILEMQIEISMGTQSNEQQQRLIGTLVSDDGLIMFDGSSLDFDHPFSGVTSSLFKATPTKIEVYTMDGRQFSAKYLGVDSYNRLGFARLNEIEKAQLTPIGFKAIEPLAVGQWIGGFALLPKHIEPSLKAGIGMISALLSEPEFFPVTTGFRQSQMASVVYNQALQPLGVVGLLNELADNGSGGSSPFDAFRGQTQPVVGIITAEHLNKLIIDPPEAGNPTRAWLGITLQAMTPDIAEFLDIEVVGGIIVNNVVMNSPAKRAGLQIGDVIVKINGEQIEVDQEEEVPLFQREIASMEPGSAVELAVFRREDGRTESVSLIAHLDNAPMSASEADEYENEQLEFKVRDMVFSDFLYHNLDEESLFGVVVNEMVPGGPAMVGGLYIGDILQQIDGQEVRSVEEAKRLMEKVETDKSSEVILFIWRDNKTLFVNVKTGW